MILYTAASCKVVADIARLKGYDAIEFIDDDPNLSTCGVYPVVGRTDKEVDGDMFVAIGNANIRERLSKNRRLITLIHPDAVITDGVEIGEGTVVMAGVVINADAKIPDRDPCPVKVNPTLDVASLFKADFPNLQLHPARQLHAIYRHWPFQAFCYCI